MSRSLAGTWFITLPSIAIVPAVIGSRPAIMRSTEDLPQPEGPSSTMNSPSATARLTSADRGLGAAVVALGEVFDLDDSHGKGGA